MKEYTEYLEAVVDLAEQAGEAILPLYDQNEFSVKLKADDSPLTDADLLSHELIIAGLKQIDSSLPILSEEDADISFVEREQWQRYWLVDPLDGTNEFISHSGQFTVNIALIENHKSVLGVTYAPVRRVNYFAAHNYGAYRKNAAGVVERIHTKATENGDKVKIIISRQIGPGGLEKLLDQLPNHELIYFGGSLKMCFLAEGGVDLYPRLGSNCEWDTASGQCIVEEAGGLVVDLAFQPLQYNTKESFYNPHFLVIADPNFAWQRYWQ